MQLLPRSPALAARFASSATPVAPLRAPPVAMGGKKKGGKPKGAKGGKAKGQPRQQETKARQEERFDAQTKQFIFSILGLSKTIPDGSRTLLKDINLCFYPGAKIGLVGLNDGLRCFQ